MSFFQKPKKATLAKTGDKYVIKVVFPYDLDLLFKIKAIPHRFYYSQNQIWTVPLEGRNIKILLDLGFTIDKHLQRYLREEELYKNKLVTAKIEGLKGTPRPFQKVGIAFLEEKKGRAIIGDEMGLGKTLQSLGWIQINREQRTPVVVVCKAIGKENWRREIIKWLPNPTIEILSGTKPYPVSDAEFLIINYDILTNKFKFHITPSGKKKKVDIPYTGWVDFLKDVNPKTLIIDEAVRIKNDKAQRTHAVKRLANGIPYVIPLSGSLIEKSPVEIFNAVGLVDPLIFPNKWQAMLRYCDPKNNSFGYDFSGHSNDEELHEKLSRVMIRRLKADVMPELPPKIRSFVPVELSNRKIYDEAETDFIKYLRQTKGNTAAAKALRAKSLVQTSTLRNLAIKLKLAGCIEWIQDFIEVENKLVIFAIHREVIDLLMAEFKDIAVKIDGSTSLAKRQKAIDDFQEKPEIKLFIGNVDAAGDTITLTASSNVAFLELPWNPGQITQAEDRCHRMGQKDSVNVYYLLAQDTIDEKLARITDDKKIVITAVLDGGTPEESNLISALMETYNII